ncbi:MAG: hypothetical protein BGN94_08175 [Rhizobiales bacterium 68-8]|nr:MAG: hypothetical protein BGN94_08175 [Rhizobiales bacterium 68-8]
MTHSDLINLWPTLADFAADIGVEYGTAKAMRRRSSVPSEYWLSMVRSADGRGIAGVTLEALAAAVAAPVLSQPEPAE